MSTKKKETQTDPNAVQPAPAPMPAIGKGSRGPRKPRTPQCMNLAIRKKGDPAVLGIVENAPSLEAGIAFVVGEFEAAVVGLSESFQLAEQFNIKPVKYANPAHDEAES